MSAPAPIAGLTLDRHARRQLARAYGRPGVPVKRREPLRPGMGHYILTPQGPKLVVTSGLRALLRWADWIERHTRQLARTMVGEATVSTVFLGLDHSFGEGPPVLFESMIFDRCGAGESEFREDQWRYTTKEAALLHHQTLVAALELEQARLGLLQTLRAGIAQAIRQAIISGRAPAAWLPDGSAAAPAAQGVAS